MQKRKFFVSFGVVLLFTFVTIKPAFAADLNWHSSIIEGASWKWKVSNYSGDLSTFFGPSFDDLAENFEIEVKAIGNPPLVGDWNTMFSVGNIAWAEFYINGTQALRSEEAVIYFFVAPLSIDNDTKGWEAWILLLHLITGYMGLDFEKSNSTSGNLITYKCSNSGEIGNVQWVIAHEVVYDTSTGILNKYKFNFSNTTLSSSITFSKISDEPVGDLSISGFNLGLAIFGLNTIILLSILRHKRKK